MRRARRATDAALQAAGMRGPIGLAGLFFAVWALVLQISLPLATQLTPASGPGVYDLVAAVTGRIHSGHGTPGADHSLPVRPDITAVLIKSDPPAVHGAAGFIVAPRRAATISGGPAQETVAPTVGALDHTRLTRAPPSLRLPPHRT